MRLLELLDLAQTYGPVALSAAVLVHNLFIHRKKDLPMSDLPTEGAPAPAPAPVVEQPIATAPAAAAVSPSGVVDSVVQTVTAHPDVDQSKAPAIITSILAGLYQAEPAIFAVTRAGATTQVEVGLGLGLAQIIVSAFLKR